MRNGRKILLGKPEGKKPPTRSGNGLKDNVKIDLTGI
jgi:hypothetical protein